MDRTMNFLMFFILSLQFLIFAQFAGGSGTEADPWLIRTPENLDSLRYYLGADNADKCYQQIADIDLGVSPWNEGEGWEPIGTVTDSLFFYGNYNGNGNRINNLTINKPDSNYIGLFGRTKGSELSSISLCDVNITGNDFIGALVGFFETNNGLISYSHSAGTISGNRYIGGLVGSFRDEYSDLRITNSYSRCNITASSTMGGIAGYCGLFSSINNSYSTGKVIDIEGDLAPGFIDGAVYAIFNNNYWDIETSECLISNYGNQKIAKGKTTYEMTHYGADIYLNWDFDNIWAEDIYGINDGYPVLQEQLPKDVPCMPDITSVEINDLDFHMYWNNPSMTRTGEILTGLDRIYITRDSILINTIESPSIGSSDDFSETLTEPGYYTYRIYGENSSGLGILAKTSQIIGQMFSGGTGTEVDPFLIESPDDLNNIRYITGYLNNKKYFQQISDIDMNVSPWNAGDYWNPIKYFTDSYNGNNYSINNLIIYRPIDNQIGLFSDTDHAVIKNINLINAAVQGADKTGAVVGYNYMSAVSDISITDSNITGLNSTGGIIGESKSTVRNCSISGGTVSGEMYTGGIIGVTCDDIENCHNSSNIYGRNYSGGICGYIQSWDAISATDVYVNNCSSNGNVNGYYNVGGLLGATKYTKVNSSYSGTGTVKGNSNVAGLIGYLDDSSVINCYSTNRVTGTLSSAGFIDETNESIKDSRIECCYSTGLVDSTGNSSGFLNDRYGITITDCYWDTEASGQTESVGGGGLPTEIMTDPYFWNNLTGWNFTDIWKIDPLLNGGYPYLKWQNLTGIEDNQYSIPDKFTLSQNYPNPFNPITKISYTVPQGFSGDVKLLIYNANGQMVKELVNEKKKSSGIYSVEFNANGLNSGMYFYSLKTNDSVISKKMLLLK